MKYVKREHEQSNVGALFQGHAHNRGPNDYSCKLHPLELNITQHLYVFFVSFVRGVFVSRSRLFPGKETRVQCGEADKERIQENSCVTVAH